MNIPPIIEPSWYAEHADEVILVDVRWYNDGRSGEQAYADGHLSGAIWIDVDTDLSAPAAPNGARHPLPTPEDFAAALGRRGIPEDATVVAYDDASGSTAGRLVWLLRIIGQPAALLNGGLKAWKGDVDTGRETRPVVTRRPWDWPVDRFASPDELVASDGNDVLIDARPSERYTGEAVVALDPRHGHIPGAVSVPWASNIDEDGMFLPAEDLVELYSTRGVRPDSGVVVYCGSGVTACTDLLALERAGVGRTRLYPGSWSEWGARTDWPMEVGQH